MKTILITGATSGIGYALAKLAVTEGYKVIACGRNQAVLKELEDKYKMTTLAFDVTNTAQVADKLASVVADIYVLNAGVCEYVDAQELEVEMFQRIFAANFFGIVNCVNTLLPNIQAGNQLVMVDSLARLLPFSRCQAYGASKAALHYFCKSLQVDLASKGIIVQSASPGFVKTPLTDKNNFQMPMQITVGQAVEALLAGIEKKQSSIYFPRIFSFLLRLLGRLPNSQQVALSKALRSPREE